MTPGEKQVEEVEIMVFGEVETMLEVGQMKKENVVKRWVGKPRHYLRFPLVLYQNPATCHHYFRPRPVFLHQNPEACHPAFLHPHLASVLTRCCPAQHQYHHLHPQRDSLHPPPVFALACRTPAQSRQVCTRPQRDFLWTRRSVPGRLIVALHRRYENRGC